MTTELVRTERLVSNFEEATRAAKAMALSGYFADAKDISQAMVKVLAGHEMGFGPFASMTGIHVIKGKPSIGANLMASAVKAHPRYDYKIVTLTPIICEIDFFEDGQLIARSDFTIAEAKKAGVGSAQPPGKPGTMLEMHPRNMLFARAMSNGVRWFTPDVFAGNAVYTPDELGAEVDDDGDVIDIPVREIAPKDSGEYTGPYINDGSPDASESLNTSSHWIEDETTRKRFWAWAAEKGLNDEDVHAALKIEHIRDYSGDKAAAVAAITTWLSEQPFTKD